MCYGKKIPLVIHMVILLSYFVCYLFFVIVLKDLKEFN